MSRRVCDIGDKVTVRASAMQSALNSRFGLLPMDRGEVATPEDPQTATARPWLEPLSTRLGR